jgi:hypothetical protein
MARVCLTQNATRVTTPLNESLRSCSDRRSRMPPDRGEKLLGTGPVTNKPGLNPILAFVESSLTRHGIKLNSERIPKTRKAQQQ